MLERPLLQEITNAIDGSLPQNHVPIHGIYIIIEANALAFEHHEQHRMCIVLLYNHIPRIHLNKLD